jgi:hemoglobin
MWSMTTIFEAAGGESGLLRLAQMWYERVLADEVVGHAFSHGFRPDHARRLAAYWTEALGGPAAYSGALGDETAVVRLHSGNGEHPEMDARAIECFDRALEDAGLAADDRLRAVLHAYFAWATAALAGYPASPAAVPEGLTVRRWSWDGLVE